MALRKVATKQQIVRKKCKIYFRGTISLNIGYFIVGTTG